MLDFPLFSFCRNFSGENYGQTLYFQCDSTCIRSEFFFTASSFAVLKDKSLIFLHTKELDTLSKFQHKKRQQTYLLGRYAAKNALSRYDAHARGLISLASVWVGSGVFNHPIVFYPGKSNIQITISHCDDRAVALAFPEFFPMGIDIEEIHQDKTNVIEYQLTHHEKQLLQKLDHSCSQTTCVLFWTLKEALSKALRIGFLSSLHLYEVDELQLQEHHWTATFKNFPQYQGICFQKQSFIVSLVFPTNSYLLTEKEENALSTLTIV